MKIITHSVFVIVVLLTNNLSSQGVCEFGLDEIDKLIWQFRYDDAILAIDCNLQKFIDDDDKTRNVYLQKAKLLAFVYYDFERASALIDSIKLNELNQRLRAEIELVEIEIDDLQGDYLKASDYYKNYLSKWAGTDDRDLLVKAAYKLGGAYYHESRYSEAIEALEEALRIVNEKSYLKPKIHKQISHYYYDTGEYVLAYKYLQKAISGALKNQDTSICLSATIHLVGLLEESYEVEYGLELMEEIQPVVVEYNMPHINFLYDLNMASLLLKAGELDSSMFYLERQLAQVTRDDAYRKAFVWCEMSKIYRQQGKFEAANLALENTLNHCEEISPERSAPILVEVYRLLGIIFMERNKHQEGLSFLRKSLAVGEVCCSGTESVETYTELVKYWTLQGTADSVMKYVVRKESILNQIDGKSIESRQKLTNYLTSRKKEATISDQLNELEKACEEVGRKNIFLIIILSFTIGGGTLLFIRNKVVDARTTAVYNDYRKDMLKRLADETLFKYLLAHEIKSPLNALEHLLDLSVVPDYVDNSIFNTKERVNSLRQKIRESKSKIEAIEYLAKFEEEKVKFSTIDLTEVLAKIVEDEKSHNSGICFFVENNTEARVVGSIPLLNIALSNVVKNAVKYSSMVNNPSVLIRVNQEAEKVKIEIEDNGRGFLGNKNDTLFEVFYRGENSKGVPGMGIGLFLTREIIAKHSGTIKLLPKQNGMIVVIRLPRNIEKMQKITLIPPASFPT